MAPPIPIKVPQNGLAVPLYHSLPDLYTFLEGTSTLSDFPDEAVREGEKIIAS